MLSTYQRGMVIAHPFVTVNSTLMGESTRREVARARTLELMRLLRDEVENEPNLNVTQAAEAVGVAPSSFYRWLAKPPAKIDITAIAALADYLHDAYGQADFATLWRSVERTIR